ncbi:MAG: YjbE family putative metal transport protein [Kiloniellales bacterium]
MSDVFLSEISAFFQVVFIDLVLAGDNAIVVGLAAAGLPLEQRRKAIALGIVMAMVMRIGFAVIATQLLAIVGLVLAGGLLLLWVAWKMWRELRQMTPAHQAELAGSGGGYASLGAAEAGGEPAAEGGDEKLPDFIASRPAKTMSAAIWQITIADLSMSLDNVLAVAGAARDHLMILIFGLVLSIALMGAAATFIARLLARYHWLSYIGLAIIAYVALSMIYEGGHEVYIAIAGAQL